jgi:hypothetical protein
MKRSIYILVAAFTFLIGISFIQNTDKSFEEGLATINNQKTQLDIQAKSKQTRFLHLGGSNFKSSGSEPIFAEDCIGCGELGDINVYHNSESIEMTTYTLNANCNGKFKVVQKSFQLNEKGEKIGERCVVVFSDEHSRIVWTESEKDVWIMSAPTVELVQEFEKSEIYKSNKLAVDKY